MPLIVIFLLIIVPSAAIAKAADRTALEGAAMVMLGGLGVGYILSLFSLISTGIYMYRLVWIISAVYILWDIVKNRKFPSYIFSASNFILLFVFAFLWWICRGHFFAQWDEMSHWGGAIKQLYSEGILISISNLSDGFKDYPPCIAPLQYILGKSGGFAFREDIIIYIQSIFSAVLISYSLYKTRMKNIFWGLLGSLLLLLMPLALFPNFYTEIMSNASLGILTAFIISVGLMGKNKPFDYTLQALAFFVLAASVRSTGILFSLFAFTVLLCISEGGILSRLRQSSAFAFALLGKLSWTVFLNVNNVPRRWSASQLNFENIYNLIVNHQPDYRVKTAEYFIWNIFSDNNYGSVLHFSVAVFAVIVFAAMIGLSLLEKDKPQRKKLVKCTVSVGIIFALYMFMVLVNYLFLFSEFEAVILASLSRYINSFLVAMVVLLGGFAAYKAVTTENAVKKAAVLAFGFALWFMLTSPSAVSVINNIAKANIHAAATANSANYYTDAADKILEISSGNPKRVYVIYQHDYALTTIKLGYYMQPVEAGDYYTSIGSEYEENDIWTYPYTPETWSDELRKNYDYVYLMAVDDKFYDEFYTLFQNPEDIQNDKMFIIDKTSADTVILKAAQ